ncbi:unnamed protein product [Soboliphyme baturini]|uniref:Uncharacterized protein n=1 Tax=Soboliphyme baturini TaxID=241478 RepID=A0A183IAU0_9BILA|nr:unnamed protein product [Soboliphyme baturini]
MTHFLHVVTHRHQHQHQHRRRPRRRCCRCSSHSLTTTTAVDALAADSHRHRTIAQAGGMKRRAELTLIWHSCKQPFWPLDLEPSGTYASCYVLFMVAFVYSRPTSGPIRSFQDHGFTINGVKWCKIEKAVRAREQSRFRADVRETDRTEQTAIVRRRCCGRCPPHQDTIR